MSIDPKMFRWIENIVWLLLGMVLSKWFDFFVKRPKLQINGSGGGGSRATGFRDNYITVFNMPGIIGLRLNGTTIFGKRIHGYIQKGLIINRSPAYKCRAFIYDKETNRRICQLWWRQITEPNQKTQEITLNSGEGANLMLFARLEDELSKYFAYQLDNPSNLPKVPRDENKFNTTKDFIVEIKYSYDTKKLRFGCRVNKGFDGRLFFEGKHIGGSF